MRSHRPQIPLGRTLNISCGAGNTNAIPSLCLLMHRWQLEDPPAEIPTDGLSEVRDLSTLGLVAGLEPPHHRVLLATLSAVLCWKVLGWTFLSPKAFLGP